MPLATQFHLRQLLLSLSEMVVNQIPTVKILASRVLRLLAVVVPVALLGYLGLMQIQTQQSSGVVPAVVQVQTIATAHFTPRVAERVLIRVDHLALVGKTMKEVRVVVVVPVQ
jgi:hypothetical protein